MKYLVVIEETETGFSAYSPDLPGCAATGTSREEAARLMKEAVEFHLEGLVQQGADLPAPRSCTTFVDVAV
jgi:predicted RNase H-like HicB family nuclease